MNLVLRTQVFISRAWFLSINVGKYSFENWWLITLSRKKSVANDKNYIQYDFHIIKIPKVSCLKIVFQRMDHMWSDGDWWRLGNSEGGTKVS